MPSVLDRSALEQSPLADLHLLANELGVDGFRRLRKPDLVDAILTRQGGERASPPRPRPSPRPSEAERRRRRRAASDDDDGPSARAAAAAAGVAGAATRTRAAGRGVDRDEPAAAARPVASDAAATSASSRASSSCWPTAPASCACRRRRDRRRRLHLRRAGQALRARLGRQDRRPGARRAPLRALPVADPRRDDQRPPGRGGRRGHPLRGPAGGLAGRAHRARLRGPDGQARSSG